eukprot:GHVU01102680.1.p1 GENE.GHVU01102680.1~~GHVU01102680.1.p1  ORF type:complete len:100 (+),score=0.70 GHVU01102680.1:229-528(+)
MARGTRVKSNLFRQRQISYEPSPRAQLVAAIRRALAIEILQGITHPREIYSPGNHTLADQALALINPYRPRDVHLIVVQEFLDRLFAQVWPQYIGHQVE